jgi:hypothetical protein
MATDGEIIRMAVHYAVANASDIVNVFWFLIDGGDPSDIDVKNDLQVWLNNDWYDAWADFATDAMTLVGAELDVINPDGTVLRNLPSITSNLPGLTTSEAEPATLAGYIQGNTNTAKVRGRKYVPGIPEDSLDDGLLDAEILADLAVLLLAYLTDIPLGAGGDLVAGVLSRVLESFIPFNGSGTTTDVPAIQRRRKPNVGS